MSKKRNDRRAVRRVEAEERNAQADARRKKCGHTHGMGVGCKGRTLMAWEDALFQEYGAGLSNEASS